MTDGPLAMTDKQQALDRLVALAVEARSRLDAKQLNPPDQRATLLIMACVTDLLRADNPRAAGHVCDALAALLAGTDPLRRQYAGGPGVVAFPGQPGRHALVTALRPLQPTRYQQQKADPLGWLLATAKLETFPDDILLGVSREYFPPWLNRRDRPSPIELRSMCEGALKAARSTSRWRQ